MTDTAQPSARALDRSLLSGIAWTGGVKWALQLLSWASTLVVARLLTPADFGLWGMATVYLGLVDLINEFGLGAAIVQRRGLERDQVAALGGLSVLMGAALCLASVALATPIAGFFDEPAVTSLIRLMSLNFVASALQILPRSLFARDLRFRTLATLDLIEGLVLITTTLTGAILGMKYWALAFGSLASKMTSALLGNLLCRHAYALPRRFARIADAVTFGWHVVVGRVAWYTYSNADFAIVGRVLGKGPLGLYSLGWQLANIPVDRISAFVGRVTPAVFSAAQHDDALLRRYVRGLSEGLALVTFPAAFGLAAVAGDLVPLALGPQWTGAILPLQLLAVYAVFRSVNTIFPQVLVAKGLANRTMQFNLAAAVLMPLAFLAGSRWGAAGVAAAWIVGYPVIAVPLFMREVFRLIGMRWREWLESVRPPATAAVLMVAVVAALGATVSSGWPHAARLALHVAAGALTYLGVLWGLHRNRLRATIATMRGVMGR